MVMDIKDKGAFDFDAGHRGPELEGQQPTTGRQIIQCELYQKESITNHQAHRPDVILLLSDTRY